MLAICAGCRPDPRDLPPDMPKVELGPVVAYGYQLDAQADPATVTRAWLRAVTYLVQANRKGDRAVRKQTLAVLAKLAAPETITRLRRSRLPAHMREAISTEGAVYSAIRTWAAITSFYIEGARPEQMKRVYVRTVSGKRVSISATRSTTQAAANLRAEVQVPAVSRDGRDHATIVVWLTREKGFWRVVRADFQGAAQPSVIRKIRLPATGAVHRSKTHE